MSRREFNRLAAAAPFVGGASAFGQGTAKPLIDLWLEGERKANYGTPVSYTGAPITLKFSSFLAPNSSLAQLHMRAFRRLEADTNGKLLVRAYWGNTLSNAQRGAFEAIGGGVADFGQAYVAFDPGGTNLFQTIQVPFLFEDSLQASWAAMENYGKYLRREYEGKGVYLVRLSTTKPLQLLTMQPVQKLEDLKGKKMWSTGPLSARFITAFGASPNPLQVTEAYTAFQSGVIDVLPTHDAGAALFRFGELAKYRTVSNLWVNNTEVGMNKAAFDRMPPDLKRIFAHWAQLWNQAEVLLYYEQESIIALANMTAHGVKSITLGPQEQARWAKAAQPVVDETVNGFEAKGLPARQMLGDLRAAGARYKAKTADRITQDLLDKPILGIVPL
jgi:TRAP-type C4-dicarboxylate transport system substrate-binding protein